MYNTGKNTGMNPHQTQFVLLQSSQKNGNCGQIANVIKINSLEL